MQYGAGDVAIWLADRLVSKPKLENWKITIGSICPVLAETGCLKSAPFKVRSGYGKRIRAALFVFTCCRPSTESPVQYFILIDRIALIETIDARRRERHPHLTILLTSTVLINISLQIGKIEIDMSHSEGFTARGECTLDTSAEQHACGPQRLWQEEPCGPLSW